MRAREEKGVWEGHRGECRGGGREGRREWEGEGGRGCRRERGSGRGRERLGGREEEDVGRERVTQTGLVSPAAWKNKEKYSTGTGPSALQASADHEVLPKLRPSISLQSHLTHIPV